MATITINNVTDFETSTGGPRNFSFIITRTGDVSAASTVIATVANGTTTAADFAGGTLPAPQTISFSAGQTAYVFNVPILADYLNEVDENFTVTLSAPTGGETLGGASVGTGSIQNDDSPG